MSLDQTNRTNNELQKAAKRSEELIEELQKQLFFDEDQRTQTKENALNVERRFHLLSGQIEEMKLALEQSDVSKKNAENQFNELADRFGQANERIANLTSEKRQLESTIVALQSDLDELLGEMKNSEERTKKNCSTVFAVF